MLTDGVDCARREVPQLMQELQLNILQQTHLMQVEGSGQVRKFDNSQHSAVANKLVSSLFVPKTR